MTLTTPPFPPDGFDLAGSEARPLAIQTARQAAADWRAAQARVVEARRRYDAAEAAADAPGTPDVRDFERWLDALVGFRHEAERRLAACLLMALGRVDLSKDLDSLTPGWAPVALELDGALYVVAPHDPDDARPRLTVVAGQDSSNAEFGSPAW